VLRGRLYALLYNFNVTSVSRLVVHEPRSKEYSGVYIAIDFASYEEAETAKGRFDGQLLQSSPMKVFNWQPARRYLGGKSWDSGRGGAHFSGTRDQGSAAGTNFERMQEEILRKAILGEYDRKIWVG
jgi:hypothetical protein